MGAAVIPIRWVTVVGFLVVNELHVYNSSISAHSPQLLQCFRERHLNLRIQGHVVTPAEVDELQLVASSHVWQYGLQVVGQEQDLEVGKVAVELHVVKWFIFLISPLKVVEVQFLQHGPCWSG